jgi:hypothetical protein
MVAGVMVAGVMVEGLTAANGRGRSATTVSGLADLGPTAANNKTAPITASAAAIHLIHLPQGSESADVSP